ncbi:hypothetical protein ACIPJK_30560 [Streptomyces roseus]|uniref:hypothetical protein n=1 Tax=Streptomyces roseus TaxID=66430 RepID=UPI00380F4CE9
MVVLRLRFDLGRTESGAPVAWAPWLVVLLLAAEAIADRFYLRGVQRQRLAAGGAGRP